MTADATARRVAAGGSENQHVAVYILVRLLVGLLLLVVAGLTVQGRPEAANELASQFRLAAVLFLAMGISATLVPRFGQERWFAWSQLAVDAIFATVLVSGTGGPLSLFFPLYFLNIVAAAWLLEPRGPLAVAALDTLAFVLVLLVSGRGALVLLFEGNSLLMYSQITLQVFAFGLVGLLSGLLSGNVRQAQAALAVQVRETRELQQQHDLVLDGIDSGVLLLDAGDTILSGNGSAERLFGRVDGRTLGDFLTPRGRTWEQTFRAEEGLLALRCSRMELGEGGALLLIEDVTRLREMEAAIAREERLGAVGRLAASLAHEIRNPLASLSGSVQLMRESDGSPLHDIVLREVKRLNELVEDFLDTARPVRLSIADCDIADIIGDVVAAFRNDARYKGRRVVRARPPTGETTVPLDESRFRQVLWKLLLNAAEATPEYGTIEVSAEATGQTMLVTVADDGVGIPPEQLEHIFDPFYTTRSGGTGLGLANVERIVRGHGGSVVVDSLPGEGSTFVLRFPLSLSVSSLPIPDEAHVQ